MSVDQKRDSLFCALALLAALAIGIVSFGYPVQSSYFPRLLAVFLGALALGLGLRVLRGAGRAEAETEPAAIRAELAGFAKVCTAVLAYLGAIQLLGYAVATLLFLLAMMLVLGGGGLLRLALVATGVTATLYYLFFIFLGVTPPEGWMTLL
jgi:hypothetical protein